MTVSPFQTSEKSQQETISCRGNRHSFQLFSGHSPEFDFLEELKAELLTSTHRLMTHNETFWRLTSEKPAAALFGVIKRELTENGWRVDHEETSFPRSSILRMVDGTFDVKVFPADRDELPASADEAWPGRVDYFVHYRNRLSQDVLRSAIRDVLDQEEPDIDFLLVFHGRASSEQRPKIVSLLEKQKPGTPAGWMALADHYSSSKDLEGCRRSLRMLTCLRHLSQDGSSISRKVRDIAKKHDIDKSEYQSTQREDWLELGLVELPEEGQPEPIEFGLESPVGYFEIDSAGKATVYSIWISEIGDSRLEAVHMECSDGSRSWSTGRVFDGGQTSNHHSIGRDAGRGRINMTTERLAPQQFRVVVQLQD